MTLRSSSRSTSRDGSRRPSAPILSDASVPTGDASGDASDRPLSQSGCGLESRCGQPFSATCGKWVWPVRLTLAALVGASLYLAVSAFWRVVASDGVVWLDYPLAALFAVLVGWIVLSFWTATIGLLSILVGRREAPLSTHVDGSQLAATDSRTAILMPVYNESPERVFAGVRAMLAELHAAGREREFDVFILSDTTDPDVWLAEERAWARLTADLSDRQQVFYRHRPENRERKSGNIADFVTRWGAVYDYMLVLDADSLVAAGTMAEMVRRMDADDSLGILQAPPMPIGRRSTLARLQQFSARFYSPAFLRGFGLWAGSDGNYWGHNAIIRVKAFLEHCELPKLPGVAPMGGEILSHDFVEAALIRRGGYKVCLADDLAGSYEESPTTLLAYAQRDQRWCQGNLQHTRIVTADGLHACSRLHLAMGVMSYIASPLWLAFLLLSVIAAAASPGAMSAEANRLGLVLFAASMGMLIAPKVYGLIAAVRTGAIAEHGGFGSALWSTLLETVVSVLIAPVMMVDHTRFVITTLLGRKVQWNAQDRDDGEVPLGDGWGQRKGMTAAGVAIAVLVAAIQPSLLPWLSPILAGLVLAPALTWLLGSSRLGRWLQNRNLLLIPEELDPPAVYRRREEAVRSPLPPGSFRDVLVDPGMFALHLAILDQTDSERPLSTAERQQVVAAGVEATLALSPQERRSLLGDRRVLEQLHTLYHLGQQAG